MAQAQAKQATFQSILDRPSGEVDRTIKVPPVGSYVVVVQGIPEEGKSSKKQTPFSKFTFKFLEAREDVSEDDLENYLTGADGSKKQLADCTIRQEYYHTEGSFGRLVDLLDHLDGIKPGTEESQNVESSTRQRLSEVAGKQCVIYIKHEAWQSGDGTKAVVASSSIAD